MTDALRERIPRDARLASAVSHELRSPPTTLVTSLEVLSSAQLVFTATGLHDVEAVVFTLEAQQVEVPTADGALRAGLLRRAHDSLRP